MDFAVPVHLDLALLWPYQPGSCRDRTESQLPSQFVAGSLVVVGSNYPQSLLGDQHHL